MSILVSVIAELGSGDLRTLLARTERSVSGNAAALRPRLREAVLADELAPEDLLRRLDEDALSEIATHHEVEVRSKKHADLLHGLAAAIRREEPQPATRKKRRRAEEPADDLERLQADVDRLLDERAKLEAKVRRLERELEHDHAGPGLDLTPDDLGELLRGIGVLDAASYKARIYRPAAKALHPDKNPEGDAAFRLLTRIRDLLEGR